MRRLLIGVTKLALWFCDTNLAQYLARLEGSSHQVNKEVFGFHGSLATWARQHHISIEGNRRRRPITGRVAMGQTAADRPLVSHLNVSDRLRAFRQQWTNVTQQI